MELPQIERGGASKSGLRGRFQAQLAEGETSDRSFGLTVGGAFVVLGLLPLLKHHATRPWMWMLGGTLIIVATVYPGILRAPKRAWLFFGFLLGQVVNPIVLGVLYAFVITPAGVLMRAFGADPLHRRFDRTVPTYWQTRTEPASDMRDQF